MGWTHKTPRIDVFGWLPRKADAHHTKRRRQELAQNPHLARDIGITPAERRLQLPVHWTQW